MRRLTWLAIMGMLAVLSCGLQARADEGAAPLATYQAALASHQPMLLEFGATWCGACKQMKPVVDGVEPQWKNRVTFVRFDADTTDGKKMIEQKQVTELPTFIFVDRNGKTTSMSSGLLTPQELEKRLAAIAAADPAASKVKAGEGCCGGDCCKKGDSPKKPAH